jgi:ABC-type Zn uptake system ZnuABC Zn-binding protein ZnuA
MPTMTPTMTIPRRITLAALVLSLVSFAPAPATRAGEVRVVASVPNIGSIASEIGGDRIHLTTIATGTQDAHFVDPKPSYIIKLRKAALLLINGLDLEIGWVPPLAQGARTNRFIPGGAGYVDCSAGIQAVEIPSILSRAEGDVHPYGNPHYLIDPLNAEIVAATIAGALARVDPDSPSWRVRRRRARSTPSSSPPRSRGRPCTRSSVDGWSGCGRQRDAPWSPITRISPTSPTASASA